MSKPVKGDNAIDEEAISLIAELKKIDNARFLRNLSQKVLRDMKFQHERNLASLNKYLDIRNEQGRGGKN
jgi:hypothetical protein